MLWVHGRVHADVHRGGARRVLGPLGLRALRRGGGRRDPARGQRHHHGQGARPPRRVRARRAVIQDGVRRRGQPRGGCGAAAPPLPRRLAARISACEPEGGRGPRVP